MESQTTAPQTPGTDPGSVPAPANPGSSGVQSTATEAQRAIWREKDRRKRLKKKALQNGQALPPEDRSALPTLPSLESATLSTVPGQGPVPWTADTLRPLLAQLVPAIEKRDVESLQKLASEISPEAISLVKSKGAWSEPAKTTLIQSGSSCAAKWMNKWGVSSEYSDELCIATALTAIMAGHASVKSDLQKIAAELKAEREKQQTQNQ